MTFAVRAGRVFDGQDLLGPATVVVTGGRVTAVDGRGPEDVLDLGDDVTLLPGLVDAHVHLAFDCSIDVMAGLAAVDDEELLVRMRAAAARAVAAGVTTVRDLGDRSFLAVRLGDEIERGITVGPTVLASGPPLTTPGGHCHFLGGEAETLDDLLRAVQRRAEAGCSVVKVMVSGGHITPGSSPHLLQFRAPELRAVVDEAHRLGMTAAAHVHAPMSIVDALDAGFDTLEHATFTTEDGVDADPDVLQRIADSGSVVSATVGALPGMSPPPAVAARLPHVIEAFAHLWQLGGRIVPGTDAGVGPPKPHDVLPYGVEWLTRVGMSPLEALRASTSGSAAACGAGDRKGRLRPGADADLLAVRGDPLTDLEALHQVEAVFVSGTRVR
jgi:imidazolonepropionase-like amidohydrolase